MQIHFTELAYKDYEWWKKHDPKKAKRIQKLCEEIKKQPFSGIGKPERLKFDLQGYWSRRIDQSHRLVYSIGEEIMVISCRYHY